MPLCPQIVNTAIPVVLTADFTVTDVVPVLAADTEQLAVTNASVTAANAAAAAAVTAAAAAAATAGAAQATANTALANAATAFNAAVGSLQPSANTIVNSSNQMTAIASNGITVFSGASSTSGARVVLNSAGLAGFNASNFATFSISATTGAAVFSGSVTGSTITGGTLNIAGNAIIDAAGLLTATGATITGAINATSGFFGSSTNGFSISATGLVGVGTGTIVGGAISGTVFTNGSTFSVSAGGAITATSGTIGGSTLASSTITGGTIQTASSGSAVILDGSNGALKFTNSSGTAVGWILPYSANGMVFNYGSSPSSAFSVFPAVALGSTSIILQANSTHAFSVSTSGVNASSLSTTGTLTANGELFAAGHSTTTNAANAFIFTTGGRIARSTASSARYKENIVNLSTVPNLDAKKLLELPVRAFTYKEGYLPSNDKRYEQMIPGFIAEEVASIYGIACDYVGADEPESWNDRMIVPAMLALIQDLYKEIDILKGA